MQIDLPYGGKTFTFEAPVAPEQVVTARSANPPATQTWEEIVQEALANPIGAPPLHSYDLRGKRVAVITDDWGRPTPASRVLPEVLGALHRAGAHDADVTVLTGSGVHQPMHEADLVRKVGEETFRRYRCLPHDAFDEDNMTFIGLSPRGTPVWINRIVAEADFRVAVGRVGPHLTHGYEGSSKMITPATSYWLTVLRNHSTNFSPYAEYGSYELNPSRRDTDDIGAMVGLHYIVNIAINRRGEPFRGFAGHYLEAHRAGIAWGDRHVWAAETGGRADITLASPASQVGVAGFGGSFVEYAAIGTKRGGTVIFVNEQPEAERELTPFQREMASWTFDEIFREHERRDQQRSPRQISDRCKTIRGEYYARRPGYHCELVRVTRAAARTPVAPGAAAARQGAPVSKATTERRGIRAAPSLEQAFAEALDRHGPESRVLVLPDAATTLPLERFHTFE